MWHQVGFLADAFAVFKEHGLSVDLVSTSETNVTVSLDPAANSLDARALEALVTSLSRLCRVEVIGPCAAVSLVGPQHPRDAAPARRRARTVRGAAHLPRHAGGQRPQHHLRRGRGAGRPARAAAARRDRPQRAVRSRARPDLGADPRRRRRAIRRAARRGGRRGATSCSASPREHGCAYVYDRATLERTAAAAARARRRRTHLLRDQGQSAPGDPAAASRRSGSRSSACRRASASACSRRVPGIDPGPDPVHAELRAALRVRVGARAGRPPHARQPVCAARSGRSCSAAATSWCASTPASGAAITITCAPRACTRSSAYRSSSSTSSSASSPPPVRAWSACTPTPAAACSTCATGRRSGQLLGDLAQRFPHVRVIDLGGGLGVPEKPGQVPGGPRGAAGRDRRSARASGRSSRSGSSRADSSWRRPACCSRR